MSRITPSVARRRLDYRAAEVAHYVAALPTNPHAESQLVGHARAAWSIALTFPKDIVAALVAAEAPGGCLHAAERGKYCPTCWRLRHQAELRHTAPENT